MIASMISAKGALTVSCPGRSSGLGVCSLPFGLALSGIVPSLSALLGCVAEAGPSGATSAVRYERSKRIGFVSRVVTEFKFADIERQVGRADLVEVADDPTLY